MTGAKTWIELAQYQRPGVKIILGPAEGREEQINPLPYLDLKKLPQFKWREVSLTMRDELKEQERLKVIKVLGQELDNLKGKLEYVKDLLNKLSED